MSKTGIRLPPKAAQTIKDYLIDHRLSRQAFANTLKVTPRTLNNWLAGRHAIDPDKLQLILPQIGVGVEDFFGGQVPKEYCCPEGVISGLGQIFKCGVAAAVGKAYISVVKLFKEQISFTKFPRTGIFQTFEHDVKLGRDYYFQFWIISAEEVEEAKFMMSFTITNPSNSRYVIRISYGEVLVQSNQVEVKQYFQPSHQVVNRPEKRLCVAKVATWFDKLPHTFVVNSNIKFKIVEKGRISEEELRQATDIAVFWKHFFFHRDD